jgi:hypothetical protein
MKKRQLSKMGAASQLLKAYSFSFGPDGDAFTQGHSAILTHLLATVSFHLL